ncbi:MAG: hypothetical protein QOJ19_4231 [Acidimicrobiia bacterium]|nr:hypothetical protein [Acidimicrobiia bacterium]
MTVRDDFGRSALWWSRRSSSGLVSSPPPPVCSCPDRAFALEADLVNHTVVAIVPRARPFAPS